MLRMDLPTERGITQYLYVLNFDSPSLSDYRADESIFCA